MQVCFFYFIYCSFGIDNILLLTRLLHSDSAQMLMMLKALFSVKWFAQANKKISAHTTQAQNEFYELNLGFPKKSFLYLASLNSLIGNDQGTASRPYPLLIGCGQYDIPMELIIFDGAGHCVNMDVP